MSADITLLYNPGAGSGPGVTPSVPGAVPRLQSVARLNQDPVDGLPLWLERAQATLRVTHGSDPVLVPVSTPEEASLAAHNAVNRGCSLVIAAGGDGTIRAVAEGVAGTPATLGIVPRGTINVLARELGIPLDDTDHALDICLTGDTLAIDVGLCGADQTFLLMCSAGFDARAVEMVSPRLKNTVGAGAYLVTGLTTLPTFAPAQISLTLDDGQERWEGLAFTVVISNIATYGGDLTLAAGASLTDGLLDITIFAAPPDVPLALQHAAFLRAIGAVTRGKSEQDPDIHYRRARQVMLTTDPAIPTQRDGDALGTTPLMVGIAPRALKVRVPRLLR